MSPFTRARPLRLPAAALAPLAVLSLTAPAQGATTLKGDLRAAPGVSVVGITQKGTAVMARATGRRFVLRFAGRDGKGATLHLVQAGRYRGPVVLARSGRKGYARLSGRSGRLGTLVAKASHAAPARKLSARLYDARKRLKVDSRGRPAGAGTLGLVTGARSAQAPPPAASLDLSPGADGDADGLPGALDVDDDGDEVLDMVDTSAGPPQNQLSRVFTNLYVRIHQSANANAGPVTPEAVDAMLHDWLWTVFVVNPEFALPGQEVRSVDVDCGALVYCRPGVGTARIFSPPPGEPPMSVEETRDRGRLWTSYAPDGDGLPNLLPPAGGRSQVEIGVLPLVARRDISPDDTFNFMIEASGGPSAATSTLGPYFVTTPALLGYDDGTGPKRLEYPVGESSPGTARNPLRPQSSTVTLFVWRPQRPAIAGAETGDLIDMGGLDYNVSVARGSNIASCRAEDYSSVSPTLKPGSDPVTPSWRDDAGDAAPDPGRFVSFTVNLAACRDRVPAQPGAAGQTLGIGVSSRRGDNAAQSMEFLLPGDPEPTPPPAGGPPPGR